MPRRMSKTCRYTSPIKLAVMGALCAAASTIALADDGPPTKINPAILHLAGDAFVTGQLRPSDDLKVLSWESPEFVQPFNFLLEAIKGVHYPAPSSPSQPQGEFCFELAGGDLLFGSLVRLSDDEAELDSPRFGRLRLRRDHIRSLYRWNVSELVYLGPNGAAGFKEPGGAKDWIEEAGQLLTDRRAATLFGDLGIPSRAIVELELSWKAKPDFSLALAVGENATPVDRAFRFEVLWRPQAAVAMLMADARHGQPVEWEYTFRDPGRNWFNPASPSGEREAQKPRNWRVGPAGFGTHDTPGAIVRTEWSTDEIWLRRRFQVQDDAKSIALSVHHDEDVRVWINGRLVHSQDGFRSGYTVIPLDRAGKILKKGENTIAVYCRQSGGGQYIDVGIVDQGTPMQGDLVAVRETDRDADLASVQRVTSAGGRTHLVAYLDQPLGRMIVSTPDGTTLADLKLPPPKPQAAGGLRLTNHDGDLRLERLRISRWNGVLPRDVQTNRSRLHRTDGSIVYGELVAVDGDAKQFVVRDGKDEVRVAADQIASVFLSPSSSGASGPPRTFRAVYQDGTQLSGELRGVGDGQLRLASSCFQEPLRLPLDTMRSLVVLKRADPAPRPVSEGTPGLLETEGLRLPGRLASGPQQPSASPLLWQPDHSLTASPLRPGVTGRITYRQPPPPMPKRSRSPLAVGPRRPTGFADTVLSMLRRNPPELPVGARRSLHLRNGDVFPCELSRIDENGITFKSPLSDATFVAHEQVKAVELVLAESPPKLNKAKWERLLTLPRMQTPSPPTHLIRSKDGDFLRGRLMSLDDKTLKVEVRTEVKEIPRERVSHIIWLHADELSPPKSGQPVSPAPSSSPPVKGGDLRVQVRQSDGNRLTFKPERFAGNSLSGTSPILGTCRADLSQVDEILIGAAIDQAKTDVAYHRWKLHRAIEPKFIQALAEPGPKVTTPGTEAALVGKPAPDFELQLLDGKKFRLANIKGRVVVLDFWATWCGPCLQLMPRIEQVVGEFKDHKVELIAINLEEPASQITSLLQRHKLQTTVALDRDGVVAAKYEATAIPHTVVIDQNGKVARLFVGGGPQVADHLRDALRELLFAPKSKR